MKKRYLQINSFAALLFLSVCSPLLAEAPTNISFNFEGMSFSDDNVGNAQFDSDIHKDSALSMIGTASYDISTSKFSMLTFIGGAGVEEYKHFDGLSNRQIFLTTDYFFQTNSGFWASGYRLFVTVKKTDAKTDIRDAENVTLGLEWNKRITDRLQSNLGVSSSSQKAKGEVFDIKKQRAFINLDLSTEGRFAYYVTYSYIDGDVVSTATGNDPRSLALINYQDAVEPDNAFGGLATGQFAYRLEAETNTFNIGTNISIGSNSSVDFSANYIRSKRESDALYPLAPGYSNNVKYERTFLRAVYLKRF